MKTLPLSFPVLMGALVSLCSCVKPDKTVSLSQPPTVNDAPKAEFQSLRPQGRPMQLMAGVPFRLQKRPVYYTAPDAPPYTLPDAVTKDEELSAFDHPLEDSILVRTTAYCQDEADHLPYGSLSAVGTPLKYGETRSAAADWSRYPVGTRFRIAGQPGIIYQVDDYGSALVGSSTIDLYRPTMEEMNDWGVRNVDIEVIEWGSYEDSLKLMKDRTKYPHVRRMVDDIQSKKTNQTLNHKDITTTPTTAMAAPTKASAPGLSFSI